MKKVIRISFAVLLAALLLVNGSGLIIGKMTCLKSGHSMVAMNEAKECCLSPRETGKTTIRGNCCEVRNILFAAATFTSASHFLLKTPPVSGSVIFADVPVHFSAASAGTLFVNTFSSPPPGRFAHSIAGVSCALRI